MMVTRQPMGSCPSASCRLRLRMALVVARSLPAIFWSKAWQGTPLAINWGMVPMSELPHLMWWSRKLRGLSDMQALMHRETLHSSAAIGFQGSSYWMT